MDHDMTVECAKAGCEARSQIDRNMFESKHYTGYDIEPHQLMLLPLYAHTQHGGCGLHVKVDGEKIWQS